jgi:hypothetical protein
MAGAGGDERLVAALENLTLQNQALMGMMTAQSAAASAKATSVSSMASLARSLDTKGMLNIDPYYGEKEKFVQWKITFYSAIETVDSDTVTELKKIERNVEFLINFETLSEEDNGRSKSVATFLLALCKDDAFNRIVLDCEKGNGYEAWRRLCKSKFMRSAAGALTALMHPTFAVTDPRMRLQQWDREATTYEQRFSEKPPDALRRSVYQTKISPTELQQHLLLCADKFPSAIDIADEIERYCDVREEHEQAMGVAPEAVFYRCSHGDASERT